MCKRILIFLLKRRKYLIETGTNLAVITIYSHKIIGTLISKRYLKQFVNKNGTFNHLTVAREFKIQIIWLLN